MNLNLKKNFRRNNWIQFGIWTISIVALTIFILIPKTEELLQALFVPFLVLSLVVPTALITYHLLAYGKKKPKFNSFFVYFPIIALAIYQLMPFYFFIESINDTGQAWMWGISIPILVYFVTIIIILKYKRMYAFKLHLSLTSIALLLYVLSFFINVFLSYSFSINW